METHSDLALSIDDLTVAYHEKPAIWDIDLDVPEGALMAIVGPNGAGKSTLIKAILNLIPRAAGTVSFYGEPYERARSLVGYVPQRGSVDWDFPTSALDVVTMGLYGKLGWFRRPGHAERELALAALEQVGLVDFADRQISQLSGGQQQRTFLARALAQDAQIYFMDEPFAAVDAVTENAIVNILRELNRRGKTVLVVHHDLQTVAEYFDWVTLLNVEIIASGPTAATFTLEEFAEDLRRARFIFAWRATAGGERAMNAGPALGSADRRIWLIIAAMVILGLLFIPLSQALFGLRLTYTVRVVALGGSILGLISGALGCFAVLRQESLLGDALSHAALPGVAIAFLLAGRELSALLIGAGIASWPRFAFCLGAAGDHAHQTRRGAGHCAGELVRLRDRAAGLHPVDPRCQPGWSRSLHIRAGGRHHRKRCHAGQRGWRHRAACAARLLERIQVGHLRCGICRRQWFPRRADQYAAFNLDRGDDRAGVAAGGCDSDGRHVDRAGHPPPVNGRISWIRW